MLCGLPIGGGGLGFDDAIDSVDAFDIKLVGRSWLFKEETVGLLACRTGAEGAVVIGGRGTGALAVGGLGADARDSGSEAYAASLFAPVSTPAPVLRNFGMPPARIPPSCGAAA